MSEKQENLLLGDYFNNESEEKDSISILDERLTSKRTQWKNKINELTSKLKNLEGIADLLNEVYSQRQIAVDYYHYLVSLYARINKKYRKDYALKYNTYTWNSQRRYPNEKTKVNQILTEMELIVMQKELISNHLKYMDNTIQTIDKLLFGIKYRIDIEQINRGK